jgi:hypothetical protein
MSSLAASFDLRSGAGVISGLARCADLSLPGWALSSFPGVSEVERQLGSAARKACTSDCLYRTKRPSRTKGIPVPASSSQGPDFRIARVFELFGLDAEMCRRDRVVGIEIGCRGEPEETDGELGIRRTGGHRIDDRVGQASGRAALFRGRCGDPSPIGEKRGLVGNA